MVSLASTAAVSGRSMRVEIGVAIVVEIFGGAAMELHSRPRGASRSAVPDHRTATHLVVFLFESDARSGTRHALRSSPWCLGYPSAAPVKRTLEHPASSLCTFWETSGF